MPITQKPIRFSIGSAREMSTAQAVQQFAKRAEDIGYYSIHYADHLPQPFAPLMTLLHAAEATSRIRLVNLVLNNDFRHPAVVAKEAATIDHFSDGRFILGIGAGHTKFEYDQAGIRFDKASVRIERLVESLTVIKGLLGDDPFTFHGTHYKIDDMNGTPKPLQRPRLPILIGGGAEKILRVAAEHGDIVSIAARAVGRGGMVDVDDALPGQLDMKVQWVREGAGQRADDIELSGVLFKIAVTADPLAAARDALDYFRAARGRGGQPLYHVRDDFDPKTLLESPCFAFGTVKQIAEHFRVMRERFGFSHFTVSHNTLDDLAPVIEELGES